MDEEAGIPVFAPPAQLVFSVAEAASIRAVVAAQSAGLSARNLQKLSLSLVEGADPDGWIDLPGLAGLWTNRFNVDDWVNGTDPAAARSALECVLQETLSPLTFSLKEGDRELTME